MSSTNARPVLVVSKGEIRKKESPIVLSLSSSTPSRSLAPNAVARPPPPPPSRRRGESFNSCVQLHITNRSSSRDPPNCTREITVCRKRVRSSTPTTACTAVRTAWRSPRRQGAKRWKFIRDVQGSEQLNAVPEDTAELAVECNQTTERWMHRDKQIEQLYCELRAFGLAFFRRHVEEHFRSNSVLFSRRFRPT